MLTMKPLSKVFIFRDHFSFKAYSQRFYTAHCRRTVTLASEHPCIYSSQACCSVNLRCCKCYKTGSNYQRITSIVAKSGHNVKRVWHDDGSLWSLLVQ